MFEEFGEEVLWVAGAIIARGIASQQAKIMIQYPVNRRRHEIGRVGQKVRLTPIGIPACTDQQGLARARLRTGITTGGLQHVWSDRLIGTPGNRQIERIDSIATVKW